MIGKNLYPDVVCFELLKDLPGVNAGEDVTIIDGDGRECLIAGKIEMSIYLAIECPDWFRPIYAKEHQERCRINTIKYICETFNKTVQEAIDAIEKLKNDAKKIS